MVTSGTPDSLHLALETVRAISRRRSTTVSPVPGGEAFLNSHFPGAHDHNHIVVTEPCEPAALAETAEHLFGQAGLGHRLVEVHDPEVAAGVNDEFKARGYETTRELVMVASREPERDVPTHDVVEVELAERVELGRNTWRREQPDWEEKLIDQLGRRIATILPAAHTTFLATRDRDGSVASRIDLHVRDGVAQVDELITAPEKRGHGFASALVTQAVERARAAGADLVFLLTDADERPQHLYRRLGFTEIGARTSFFRECG